MKENTKLCIEKDPNLLHTFKINFIKKFYFSKIADTQNLELNLGEAHIF